VASSEGEETFFSFTSSMEVKEKKHQKIPNLSKNFSPITSLASSISHSGGGWDKSHQSILETASENIA
jgi:hypothetical protein